MVDDAFSLARFVTAQDAGGTYERALAELRAGRKQSHWMWFVFPQVAGLGQSPTARTYAVSGLDEGRAYLAHPVLGARLREAALAVADAGSRDPVDVMGSSIDAMKLRSSMTLFVAAAQDEDDERLFQRVLDRYFAGEHDPRTTALLA
ncbi:DUF1810 domain-containing protein [Intrasporangium sp. YIM S08009]|uniref:DUF1810 domain-containing protein n=1 Tax=Intrasporangium zincisolvens TaxID=3080018 RepID=UPI002B05CB7C|nr:DUF1810 domain-containing protein [Intrasporangium sp. YIM S08009]